MFQGHGDDRSNYSQEIMADFSTNVWYGAEPPGLKEHLFAHWELVNRYPEVLGASLTAIIAAHHRLTPENILVTNGSTESIYLVAELFSRARTIVVTPTFSEYADACTRYSHKLIRLPWTDLDILTAARLIFICNPNNPDGALLHDAEALISNNPDCLFVIDEAFIEFTEAAVSLIPLLSRYDNLLVMRSMTKVYAIPGLRLGYLAGNEKLIDALRALKQPWSVNSLALEAGKFIFNGFSNFQLPLGELLSVKTAFIEQLAIFPVRITSGYTHFFLVELPEPVADAPGRRAADLKSFLLKNYGILIRDASNFYGLTDRHFRLATLSREKNELLLGALKEWFKHE